MRITKSLMKEGGLLSTFTKGLAARVLWVTPSVMISMSVFERLKDWRESW
jgi:hypothetical protein